MLHPGERLRLCRPRPHGLLDGGNAENLLALEWVTPTGDVVRTGSLGSDLGWFAAEGPGPSVRGVCRGTFGSRGGMGVYTKCAIKLCHRPGRTDWDVHGTVPAYRRPVDDLFRVYTLAVPSWDAWADLYYKSDHRGFPASVCTSGLSAA